MTLTTLSIPTGDFVTTSLTGAISAAATSATIGTGLTLPATNGVLQIDYDSTEVVGDPSGPETITYAAYNTGTGALTGVVRGAAGTTGVTHANAASVQCAISVAMWNNLSDIISQTAWTAWTPTWTNLTKGAGVVTAKYIQIGKTVFFRLSIVFAADTSIAGSVSFTLPVTAVDQTGSDGTQQIGTATIYDSGTATFMGTVLFFTTTTALARCLKTDGTYLTQGNLSSSAPMTWTTNDEYSCEGKYEAA